MILSKKNRNCHELWYNERMKYPKINLKEVRQQARQFQAEHPRLLLVFLLPSILLILSSFLRPLSLLDEGILDQSFLSFLGTTIQSALFPIAVGFSSRISICRRDKSGYRTLPTHFCTLLFWECPCNDFGNHYLSATVLCLFPS